MNPDYSKLITFLYENDQCCMQVRQQTQLEKLIDHIKSYFEIDSNQTLNFIDIKREVVVVPSLAIDFWMCSSDDVPVYRIKISNSQICEFF